MMHRMIFLVAPLHFSALIALNRFSGPIRVFITTTPFIPSIAVPFIPLPPFPDLHVISSDYVAIVVLRACVSHIPGCTDS